MPSEILSKSPRNHISFQSSPHHLPFRSLIATLTNCSTAIAREYGDGVTGKAVSERFVRLKKEPDWNLNNTEAENGSTPKSTPRKRAAAKPKAGNKKKVEHNDDDSNEEGSNFDDDESPSKKPKGALNKTKGGRITKTTPSRAARPAPGQFSTNDDDDDDDEEFEKLIKGEDEVERKVEQ